MLCPYEVIEVIYWLLSAMDQAPLDDERASPSFSFLSEPERAVCAGLRFAKRRADWLLGRWTAKQLLCSRADYAELPLAEITVDNEPGGAPYYRVDGERLPLCLSISHRGGRALCALSDTHTVGVDLERIEAREPAFVGDFFTASENALVQAAPAADRDLWVTLIWSVKESALKVLRQGLRIDTRRIEITFDESWDEIQMSSVKRQRNTQYVIRNMQHPPWLPLHIECHLPGTPRFTAWWRIDGGDVLTLAAAVPEGSTDWPEICAV